MDDVADEPVLVALRDMLEHVEGIGGIERAGYRTSHHIVHERLDRPMRIHAFLDVGNEDRIEIDRRNLADRLLDDPRAEGVGATDFEGMLAAAEHPGDEFVTGKRKERALGILV